MIFKVFGEQTEEWGKNAFYLCFTYVFLAQRVLFLKHTNKCYSLGALETKDSKYS